MIKHYPSVSVLIPTFNRAHMLAESVRSVFSQTVPINDVIVADDGSTDDTQQTIEQLLEEYPNWRGRLQYFHQPNQGRSVALNAALERSHGEWIAYNDSDDVWLPDKLKRQFDALADYPEAGACVTDARYGGGGNPEHTAFQVGRQAFGSPVGEIADAPLVMAALSHGIYTQTLVVQRRIVERMGGWDEIMRVAQDVDFLFRLSLECPIVYVNEPLVEIDRGADWSCERLTVRFPINGVSRLELHEKMYTKWRVLVNDAIPELSELTLTRLNSNRSALANQYLIAGRKLEARHTLERALRDRFSRRLLIKWVLACCFPQFVLTRIVARRARESARGA